MDVGEVRVADDRDFRRFLDLAENTEGWQSKYNKNGTKVWVQLPKAGSSNDKSRMLKTIKFMENVSAATCYDVIHDPHFRPEWDTTMLEGKEVYMINPNNDISYYAVKCPSPLKNRDFIMQRTWLMTPTEFVIFNHSIYHTEFPPRKGLIRGESILTGYLIRPKGKISCELTYVTQMDPKGTVPMWAVNKVAEYLAPSLLKNLHKACQSYPAWKSVNNPHYKPWLYPEQMNLPRIDMAHILSKNTFSSEESLEDGDLKEEDFKGDHPATSIPRKPERTREIGRSGEPQEQSHSISPRIHRAQSENSFMQPLSSSTTPPSSSTSPPSSTTPISSSTTPPSLSTTPTSLSTTPRSLSTTPRSLSTTSHSLSTTPRSLSTTPPSPSTTPPSISTTPPSMSTTPTSTQTSPSRQQYSQTNQHQDIKITKRQDRSHHGSMPAIYHNNQNHTHQPHANQYSMSLGRGEHLQNGLSPSPHTSPLGYIRKKFAKWTVSSRQATDYSDDLHNMDYQQLQKEIMIREHEARMVAFQEELEMKRREHQMRMDLLDAVARGGSKGPNSDIPQVLLHRTSSIVTNEMILGKADVNGYIVNRGRNEVRSVRSSPST